MEFLSETIIGKCITACILILVCSGAGFFLAWYTNNFKNPIIIGALLSANSLLYGLSLFISIAKIPTFVIIRITLASYLIFVGFSIGAILYEWWRIKQGALRTKIGL